MGGILSKRHTGQAIESLPSYIWYVIVFPPYPDKASVRSVGLSCRRLSVACPDGHRVSGSCRSLYHPDLHLLHRLCCLGSLVEGSRAPRAILLLLINCFGLGHLDLTLVSTDSMELFLQNLLHGFFFKR